LFPSNAWCTGDEGAKDAEGTLEGGEDEEELAWGRPS